MNIDRINIDKSRQSEIRKIKDNGYLAFDNQKDVFMYALATGMDSYNGGVLEKNKDALFNDRDLNESDKAIIYALIEPELDKLEDITDRELVLKMAEGMADKGFTIILDEMEEMGPEVYRLKMLNRLNELYSEAEKKEYFKIR